MRLFYGFCILLYTFPITSIEYSYPVASLDDTTVLCIHQTSLQNTQLFSYNIVTNHTEQILWSLFTPAGIQLLPHNKGFSFIDNGRLRIKVFSKRSPKTIDFDEPIFNIHGLYWIDEHSGYCSAYYNNHFSIFELHDDGKLVRLIHNDDRDCMYPQKINDWLFYIERKQKDHNNNYAIMQTLYKLDTTSKLVLNFGHNSVIFLQMVCETEGFVIEYQKDIDDESTKATFQYHRIWEENNSWHSQSLFSFEIPINLFLYDNDQRLFESILPLLPRIIDYKIYFVDCSDKNLEPHYYDMITKERCKIDLDKQQGHIFVPIQCGSKLCFGGTKIDNSTPFLVF